MFGEFCVFCVFYNHSFLDFDYTLSRGHPIALNRTHVMILQVEIFSKCLHGWIYSFISFKWNGVNQCIYPLNNTDVDIVQKEVDPCQKINSSKVYDEEFEINGASYIGKNGLMKIFVLINGYYSNKPLYISSRMILVDINNLTSTKIEHDAALANTPCRIISRILPHFNLIFTF